MTELRRKMIRAMELKNLSPHTRRAYLAAVTGLARHYRQSPAAISKRKGIGTPLRKGIGTPLLSCVLFEKKSCYVSIMPRRARIDAPGALHHVNCRGIERREIFG